MAGLSSSRHTDELADDARFVTVGVEANTSVFLGAMVALDAGGYAVPAQTLGASPLNALRVLGRAERLHLGIPGQDAINTSSATIPGGSLPAGAAGAIAVVIRRKGVFGYDNDGSITDANIGRLAFVADDHTVSAADGSGATTVPNTTSITLPASGTPQIVVLHQYIVPGSVVVTSSSGGGGTQYAEGTDYAIGYQTGLFTALPGGRIAAGDTVYLTYKYGAPTRPVAGTIVQIDTQVWVDFSRQSAPAQNAAGLAN